MKMVQCSTARRIVCGLALAAGIIACDERVDALGVAEMGISSGRYPDNSEQCPEAPTAAMTSVDQAAPTPEQSSCADVPVGTFCAYDVKDAEGAYQGWAGYVCSCRDGAEGLWYNIGTAIQGFACPEEPPVAGSVCSAAGPCPYYPNRQAECLGGIWTYTEMPRFYCDVLGVVLPEL